MTTPTAIVCFALALLLAGALFLVALKELLDSAWHQGYTRGKADTEKWISEQGKQVEKTQEEIWRGWGSQW